MHLPYQTYDVFTTQKFTGNPLAIILLSHSPPPVTPTLPLSSAQRQKIATEFNLSECVFLSLPPSPSPSSSLSSSSTTTTTTTTTPNHEAKELQIYIHTSFTEINFAGHPTIGSAYYLLKTLGLQISTLVTRAGRIPISLDPETELVSASIPQAFHVHALSFRTPLHGATNPVVSIVKGMSFILVQLPDLEGLGKVGGNLNGETYEVGRLDEGWKEGLCCTLYFVYVGEGGGKRYRTRMFGTREDPGTGSASCALACWLATRGASGDEAGKGGPGGRYLFEQGVEMGRRNEICVEVGVKEGEVQKVVLSGKAVRVMEGKVEIDGL